MSSITDPYNLNEVLDACSKHAWATRAGEFQRRGIGRSPMKRGKVWWLISSRKACKNFVPLYGERGNAMNIEIKKDTQIELAAQAEEQAQTIHDILYRKKTSQEKEAFEARVKTIFERYDQTFRNLANERSGES